MATSKKTKQLGPAMAMYMNKPIKRKVEKAYGPLGGLFNPESGVSSPYVLYTRLIREGMNYKEAAKIAGIDNH